MTLTLDVVDLDGTLVRRNTFPHWVAHLILSAAFSGRPRRCVSLLGLLVRRKLGLIGHGHFKEEIARASSTDRERTRFAARMARYACPEVGAVLRRRDGPILIATAAVGDYVPELVRLLGISPIALVTAGWDDQGFNDNRGTDKARRVRESIDGLPLQANSVVVFTDHVDDLPLVRECDAVFACNAEAETVRAFRRVCPDLTVLPTTAPRRRRLGAIDLSDPVRLRCASEELADRAVGSMPRPDVIVGIATGGRDVGRCVADHLGVTFCVVRARRRGTRTKQVRWARPVASCLPDWMGWALRRVESSFREIAFTFGDAPEVARSVAPEGELPTDRLASARHVLVVDDAVDTGYTLASVVDFVRQFAPLAEVHTVALATSFRSPIRTPDVCLYDHALLRGPWSLDA